MDEIDDLNLPGPRYLHGQESELLSGNFRFRSPAIAIVHTHPLERNDFADESTYSAVEGRRGPFFPLDEADPLLPQAICQRPFKVDVSR